MLVFLEILFLFLLFLAINPSIFERKIAIYILTVSHHTNCGLNDYYLGFRDFPKPRRRLNAFPIRTKCKEGSI